MPLAIQKGTEEARKNLFSVAAGRPTITHPVIGEHGRRPRAAEARRSRYRRDRRWRGPGHPRGGRHPRRALQVARLVQPHQRRPRHDRRAQGAQAARRGRPPARPRRPRSSCPKGLLERLPRDRARPACPSPRRGARDGASSRSPRSGRPSAPSRSTAARCARSACGRIGKSNTLPDRPEIRGMIARVPHLVTVEAVEEKLMKIHDLKPAPGSNRAPQARRPRHRRQGRQDRRPRHQGPEGPRQGPGRLRGRPDAAAHARARSCKGFNNPFRVEYQGINLDVIDEHRPRRGHARDAARPAASPTRAPWSRCSAGARSPARCTVKAHAFSKSAEAAITAAGGTR